MSSFPLGVPMFTRYSCDGLHPSNFGLFIGLFVLELYRGTRQTHGQTDTAAQFIMPCLSGRGHNNVDYCWDRKCIICTDRDEGLWTLKCTPMEHAYQLPRPAITACEVEFLHADGGIPCRLHPAAPHNLYFSKLLTSAKKEVMFPILLIWLFVNKISRKLWTDFR